MNLRLSALPHTWLIDLDGTMLKHNGHKQPGGDQVLPGVPELWARIPAADMIILLSARKETEMAATLAFLRRQGLRFDRALFELPVGERILINDAKPGGLQTALAVNVVRDGDLSDVVVTIDPEM